MSPNTGAGMRAEAALLADPHRTNYQITQRLGISPATVMRDLWKKGV
jgi:hypothetical protein